MTVTQELPEHPPNPHPEGSEEAAEWEEILTRLTDPDRERRAARFLRDLEEPPAIPDVEEHAAHAFRLSTAGVLAGPDCSYFQGAVDWGKVAAAGCRIGGYKVSEGRTYEDPQHRNNRARVPANGLVPLAYHFLYGTGYGTDVAKWRAQADWYCSLVDPHAIHALDVEAATPAPGAFVAEWIDQYRKHFPSKILLIYTNKSLWLHRSNVVAHGAPAGTPVWHAGYRDGLYAPGSGSILHQWDGISSVTNSMSGLGYPDAPIFQITDHAAVPGVSGTCDGNAAPLTLTQLKALAGQTGDDMSQADVDAILAGLQAQLSKLPAAVWNFPVVQDWDGQPNQAQDVLASAQRYSIEASAVVDRPKGNAAAGTPTFAKKLIGEVGVTVNQTDTLEASEVTRAKQVTDLGAAIAGLPDVIAGKLSGSADAAVVKQAVIDGLREQLPGVHLALETAGPLPANP